uniref:VTT domain-containing protein n=1 Tax=Emiliania huxleyi TaxID=2903 RepID=A0A7S3W588_EMIHU
MRQLLLLALAASASGLASLFQPARPPLRARSCAAQEPGGQEPGEPEAKGPLAEAKESWRRTRALVAAFSVPRIEEDDLPEAVALHKRLEQAKAGGSADVGELSRLTAQYYRASYERVVSRPAVKEGLPVFFSAANGAIALLVLRLLLPRLLAIESMGDLYDLAPELGLPTKEELATYIDYAQALDLPTKFGLFLLIICAEKVTLVGEILPVGVVLPSLSPVLFGGVLQGTLISAFCAAVGSSLNFVLGKSFLYERVRNLEIFGQPPVKDTTWYRALSANIEKDGFKAALLLRLAPVLPIPIDAHWCRVWLHAAQAADCLLLRDTVL